MSDEHDHADDTSKQAKVPGRGDDERENRERIDQTGEPETDALGNADGAS